VVGVKGIVFRVDTGGKTQNDKWTRGQRVDSEGRVGTNGRERNRGQREQLLHRSVQRFRGGLVLQAHRLCASLTSRFESDKEERTRRIESREGAGGDEGVHTRAESGRLWSFIYHQVY